uniref:Uncharacterized protein n=1 Tax=Ochrobactrum phage ORM_20 TaxID=2985243 RepID=A0A9N6WV14_9VIRU|nr:hypothetical protein ORM20_00159 [Ochrobactrum phage ORM_20]
MPAMVNEIEYTSIYGTRMTIANPINVDPYPSFYYSAIGEIIMKGIASQDIDFVIKNLKQYRTALAYNIKVMKALRKNVHIFPFYVNGRYYSPFDLSEAQSAIAKALSEHKKFYRRLEILIRDFQERKRLRLMAIANTPVETMAFQAEEFFLEAF